MKLFIKKMLPLFLGCACTVNTLANPLTETQYFDRQGAHTVAVSCMPSGSNVLRSCDAFVVPLVGLVVKNNSPLYYAAVGVGRPNFPPASVFQCMVEEGVNENHKPTDLIINYSDTSSRIIVTGCTLKNTEPK